MNTVMSDKSDSTMMVPEFGWTTTSPECSAPYIVPVLKNIVKKLGLQGRLLDVGCGNGFNANKYVSWGFDVVGVDVSVEGIAIAKNAYPQVQFESIEICADLLSRIDQNPFDAVSSTEVVEHLYDPHAWAKCCYNALRPGGVLIASTPYHGFLKNLFIAVANGWGRHHEPLRNGGHIKFFNNAQLSQLLMDAGFHEIRFIGVGRAPLLWKSIIVIALKPKE